jgi:predicted RNase H-like nuclease
VFPAPCRKALEAADRNLYRTACDLNFAACGRKLSKQCHGILPKILHVDLLIQPGMQTFIKEAHPEVGFAFLNGGRPVDAAKKSPEGQRERLRILARHGVRASPARLDAERARLGRSRLQTDDLIDALACLAIARRIAQHTASRFPAHPAEERDQRGLVMEIWG